VPAGLKIFLTALAIIDDLGAIIVIAVFYSAGLQWLYLILVTSIFLLMLLLNYLKVRWLWLYLLLGIVMWYCMLQSGVHTTITGVLLAFALPFNKNKDRSLSHWLEKAIHLPVAFIIVPLFALANTAIVIPREFGTQLLHANSMGIVLGLVCGKPIGIFLCSLLVLRSGLVKLPEGVRLRDIFGAGILAGIGFTMSIFITLLAFSESTIISNTKMNILVASLIAGIGGLIWLGMTLKKD
jgi:NhaA family Na+:H+ antiporter